MEKASNNLSLKMQNFLKLFEKKYGVKAIKSFRFNRQDITQILLKVVLSTINLNLKNLNLILPCTDKYKK
jgi:hypothetical protein